MRELLKDIFDLRRFPWLYLALALGSGVIAIFPELRPSLVYHRTAISNGEFWRIWTGHLVHFGWPHYLADGALFVFIGWAFERSQPALGRLSLALLPLAICAALFWFDPTMTIYGGLSGINVGLLVFLACRGWQKDWKDWFWPAILGIHAVEVVWEARTHGTGGGAIRFDDSSIRVATVAHLGGVAYGVFAWALIAVRSRLGKSKQVQTPAP